MPFWAKSVIAFLVLAAAFVVGWGANIQTAVSWLFVVVAAQPARSPRPTNNERVWNSDCISARPASELSTIHCDDGRPINTLYRAPPICISIANNTLLAQSSVRGGQSLFRAVRAAITQR